MVRSETCTSYIVCTQSTAAEFSNTFCSVCSFCTYVVRDESSPQTKRSFQIYYKTQLLPLPRTTQHSVQATCNISWCC